MLVVAMAERAMSLSVSKSSADLRAARHNAPTAPTPAASVGVAAPTMMEPKTTPINSNGGNTAARIEDWPSSLISSGAGQSDGLRQATNSR